MFHTFVSGFYCWLWTSKRQLSGKRGNHILRKLTIYISFLCFYSKLYIVAVLVELLGRNLGLQFTTFVISMSRKAAKYSSQSFWEANLGQVADRFLCTYSSQPKPSVLFKIFFAPDIASWLIPNPFNKENIYKFIASCFKSKVIVFLWLNLYLWIYLGHSHIYIL